MRKNIIITIHAYVPASMNSVAMTWEDGKSSLTRNSKISNSISIEIRQFAGVHYNNVFFLIFLFEP